MTVSPTPLMFSVPLDPLLLTLPQQGGDASLPATPGVGSGAGSPDGAATTGIPATPNRDGSKDSGASGAGGSFLDSFLMFALIGGVIYFLIFAPERKARKTRQAMLAAVKKGDKVITTGGMHAQVADVREHEIVLKAGDVRLTFSRSAIHEIVQAKEGDSSESS